MRFAHSLGYPHYELMLAALKPYQLVEFYAFFRVEADEQEEIRLSREDANIERFFNRAEKLQKQLKAMQDK
jgi:hypothetical protein